MKHTARFLSVFYSDELTLIMALEITRCFGGELKSEALRMHMTRNVKPNVKLILDALARGEDPIHVALIENVRSATQPGKGR